ncbi:Thiol-disulfide oxidoreductase resA, putative [Ricinus communis]|uniref:glutaredoxin-dependent peroxiredoxin n=1 Tax=Ricinus communis TaxID=3988 RepID=B9TPZ4_RICCO|nr:Thiol-disulfide oxidoreductase resA, putative [Ricinus communis]
MFVVALVAARVVFILRYQSLYFASPLTMLDIRDGGWDAQAGVIAAWVYALVLWQRERAARKAVAVTVGTATMLWLAGTALLMANTGTHGAIPASVLSRLDGQPVALADFRGKPTVVNFWATWCPPCQKEMPAMAQVQRQRPDVNFVFVNQGESPQVIQGFLQAGRLALNNVLLDPAQATARGFSVMGYPTTLFFDATGKLVYQHMGPLSEAALLHHVDEAGTQAPRSLVK